MVFGEWCLFVVMFLGAYALVHGQSEESLSLNCGGPGYNDMGSGIDYVSDSPYITSGSSKKIDRQFWRADSKHLWDARFFPNGLRNCYTFDMTKGDRYYIRADFFYDGQDRPEFDIYIGSVYCSTVSFPSTEERWNGVEVIHELQSRHLHVCLAKTGSSVPFISALLLRRLNKDTYNSTGLLQAAAKYAFGSTSNNLSFGDAFDRSWGFAHSTSSEPLENTTILETRQRVKSIYQIPELLMRSALAPRNVSEPMIIAFELRDPDPEVYVYMYFAELLELEDGESREFSIYFNEKMWETPFSPRYLDTTLKYGTFHSTDGRYSFVLQKTEASTLPPLINAMEIYLLRNFSGKDTNEGDVTAIRNVKMFYRLNKTSWQGDPCSPLAYTWDGVKCMNDSNSTPRITSLNLASSGLQGVMTHDLVSISQLVVLDLSNNNLTGTIPEFLSRMTHLKVINLRGNNFTGTVPPLLLEKSGKGLLRLSVEDNPYLCVSGHCNHDSKKKTNVIIITVSTVASVVVLVSAIAALRVFCKRRKNDEAPGNTNPNPAHNPALVMKREFSYPEVERITEKFTRVLGKGGFGVVYHGVYESQEVAVKLLDRGSTHAYDQFIAEAGILLRVHHRNLVSLNGYCCEDDCLALIYEFMEKGDLKDHLSGKYGHTLSWETRMKIATQVAQGLEYLHNGCYPPVVHRDVKSRNILLDGNFNAKLGDFGLSKSFPCDGETHISTVVAGTDGYLDPEYRRSNRLTDRSDVYSFGVVLLELITNQPVIGESEKRAIVEWTHSKVQNGETSDIVDPQLGREFDASSLQKAVGIALACADQAGCNRPSMKKVVLDLNECLELEIARNQGGYWSESSAMTPR